jgi:hypothetical protein
MFCSDVTNTSNAASSVARLPFVALVPIRRFRFFLFLSQIEESPHYLNHGRGFGLASGSL